ncbi:MAG: transposase [Parabacteroides sp.]
MFNAIAITLYKHYNEVLNFFVNRATNVFAESFNAKIKAFKASLSGVTDTKPLLFRFAKLYANPLEFIQQTLENIHFLHSTN